MLFRSLGRKFTGLTYQEADLLSKDNKEFIHALFPDDPIHTELLPDDVQALIGQVGPDTKAVEKMLRRIGFDYAGQIDPFDGGPHFSAATDAIAVVRDARQVVLKSGEGGDGKRVWAILAVERPTLRPGFVATGARVTLLDDGAVGVSDQIRRRLDAQLGEMVWMAPG